MNVLFVENMNLDKDNNMSTCYNIRCNKMISHYNFFDITSKFNQEILNNNIVIFGARSIPIYKFYMQATNKGIRKIIEENISKLFTIPNKYFIIQDMHEKTYGSIEKLCNFLNENKINIIFTFYQNAEASKIRKLTPNCKSYHLPMKINKEIFYPRNEEKIYDIILYGSIHPSHYPFRKRLFELILNNKDKYKIKYIEKPEAFNPELCEDGLAKLISQSKIGIATKSKYDYFVGKYTELALCKCGIFGDRPTDCKYLKIFEVNNKMTDEEIIRKLDEVLNQDINLELEFNFQQSNIYYTIDSLIKDIDNIISS